MTSSAVTLALIGFTLTFLPAEVSEHIGPGTSSKPPALFLQILGALYFGFAMLNWMARQSVIGGIYNKPTAISNFAHFFIGAMALVKGVTNSSLPYVFVLLAIWYSLFAVLFGIVTFRHPSTSQKA